MRQVKVQNLIHAFPDFQLGPLSFSFKTGDRIGLIGSNGAGKTTLIRAFLGLLRPTKGNIHHLPEAKEHPVIGYAGPDMSFYEKWSAGKNLDVIRQHYPEWEHERTLALIDRLQLPLKTKVRDLSLGNRMKLALIIALSTNPDIILLDEPTNSLDPVVKADVLDALKQQVKHHPTALLVSSHHIGELDGLVNRLLLMRKGKLISDENPEDLRERFCSFHLKTEKFDHPHLTPGYTRHQWEDGVLSIISHDANATRDWFLRNRLTPREQQLSLEEIAVNLLRQEQEQ